MKKLYRRISALFSLFQTKLLTAFLLCALLPLTVISFVSYSVSRSIAWDKTMDSSILAADQLHVQLTERINQAENVADTLQYYMYSLLKTDEQEIATYLDMLTLLRTNISLYISTFDFHQICVFLQDDKFGSREGLYFYPLSALKEFSVSPSELHTLGASSLWMYRPQVQSPFLLHSSDSKTDSAICCRALFNQGSRHLDYAYFIVIDTTEFSSLFAASFLNTDVAGYLVLPDGLVIAASEQELCGEFLPAGLMQDINNCTEPYFRYEDSYFHSLALDNGWYQVTEIPTDYITDSTAILLRTILLTLLFALPATLLVIFFISRNLSMRIHTLSNTMKEFRLNPQLTAGQILTVSKPENPNLYDEIDELGLTFEQMQTAIAQNMHSLLDFSLKEERLKYQLLQSQINPHFLYNILGTIRTCQSLGKLDIADRMITDLTRFYRMTLHKSGELILLKDELEIATLYLNMEKLCHNNNLDWEINLEDGIENFLICRFTLQPFLENSIVHGISAQTPNILIRIDISYGDDTVLVKIADNGIGIMPDKLLELRQSLDSRTITYDKHFGICNVNARISSAHYGNGHIDIQSSPGNGTCITIEFLQMEGVDIN